MRQKFVSEGSNVQADSKTDKSQGAARAISSFIDPGLSWRDIPWFQSITKMPIILKGVQCWEVRPATVVSAGAQWVTDAAACRTLCLPQRQVLLALFSRTTVDANSTSLGLVSRSSLR